MLPPCLASQSWLLLLLQLLSPSAGLGSLSLELGSPNVGLGSPSVGLGSSSCWDDLYSSCPARALRGECEGEHIARGHTSGHVTARIMLGQCRESCYNR